MLTGIFTCSIILYISTSMGCSKGGKMQRFQFFINHVYHSSTELFNCYNDEVIAAVRSHKFVAAFDTILNMWQKLDYASVMNGTLSTPIYVLKPIVGAV